MSKERTYEGAEILGKATGLGKKAIRSQWEIVKANHKLLKECEGQHNFQSDNPGDMNALFVCSKCGGKIKKAAWIWYQLGLEHGRNEEIWK